MAFALIALMGACDAPEPAQRAPADRHNQPVSDLFKTFFDAYRSRTGVSLSKTRQQTLLRRLKIMPGDAVADVGAGNGFYTYPMSEAVGHEGRIYAIDSNESATIAAKRTRGRLRFENIESISVGHRETGLDKVPDSHLAHVVISDWVVFRQNEFFGNGPQRMKTERFLRVFLRVLKPGGSIVYSTGFSSPIYLRARGLKQLFRQAGFTGGCRDIPMVATAEMQAFIDANPRLKRFKPGFAVRCHKPG